MPADPDRSSSLVVLKFGGSSVGTPDRFRTLVDVVQATAREARVVVVVSALSKVTRQLSGALEAFTTHSTNQDVVVDDLATTLRTRHREHAFAVLSRDAQSRYAEVMDDMMAILRRAFDEVEQRGFSPAARDTILSVGERLSVPMTLLALRDAGLETAWMNATRLMVTDDTFGEANVDHETTRERVRDRFKEIGAEAVAVAAGFIGTTHDGRITTLGFEGSDYSAALFAQMLDAHCLTRFTDVDGLYSDDPNTNADAERLTSLSMETAYARTESGHLGMHPKTLRPLAEAGIPMQVRSILDPDAPGTHILPDDVGAEALIPTVNAAAQS